MNEVTKLYENAGIEPYKFDGVYYHHIEYPPFTAEKQLELIKWLSKRNYAGCEEKLAITIGEDNYCFVAVGLRIFEEEQEIFTDYCADSKTFEEALAKLVNNLWQSLTEEEHKQIKNILK